jgi:O-antigen ligase
MDAQAGIRPGYILLSVLLLGTGLALALLPLPWVAFAVLGLAVVAVTLVRPEVALYLLCFSIPFGSLLEVGIGGEITVGASEGLIALAAAAWLAHTMAWRTGAGWPRLTVPFLLFLGAAGLSLLNVAHVPLSFKETAKWIEFLVVLVIVVNVCDSGWRDGFGGCNGYTQSQLLVACLLLAGIAQAVLGGYQFLTRSGPESFAIGRFIRAYGTFEQPNPYAGYLGLTAPLALSLTLLSTTRSRVEDSGAARGSSLSDVPGWLRWLALSSFVATSVGIGMSASRGGWLAFGVAFVFVNVGQSRRGAVVFVGAILLALLTGLLSGFRSLPVGITQRLTSFLPFVGVTDVGSIEVTDANYASLERLAFWRVALDMWRDHPLLGVGFGNYQAVYARYALPKWRMALGHAHNYYLNIAAETGLIGLLAYLMLWGAAFWQTIQASLRAQGRYARAIALGALGVLVHVSVHNVVDNLWVHNMYIQVAIVLGLVQSQLVSTSLIGEHR